jgi:hypothetical protein
MSDQRYGRLKQALDEARRELVDPSRRNRLLHSPLTGKRPWCMAIVGHDVDELFNALHRQENFRGYAFQGRDKEEADTEDNTDISQGTAHPSLHPALHEQVPEMIDERTKDSAVRSPGRPRLQTRLSHERLEKRLTKIYREERTLEEEQGISTLYLALGFLKWFDSDQSNEFSFAPLLLVPVSLDRVQGRDGYVLSGRDDDIVVNVSLREKLRDFEIVLPEIPEGDDWKPSDYFLSVEQSVVRQRRFEVDRKALGLGFFTFSKFMMWRDLNPDEWPNGGLIEHVLLSTLLGEGGEFDNGPPIVLEHEPIDDRIDLSTAVHVVDADSSQAVVIEEARSRRNLVVQGPPGTGKSQTITNIIASAVREAAKLQQAPEFEEEEDLAHEPENGGIGLV